MQSYLQSSWHHSLVRYPIDLKLTLHCQQVEEDSDAICTDPFEQLAIVVMLTTDGLFDDIPLFIPLFSVTLGFLTLVCVLRTLFTDVPLGLIFLFHHFFKMSLEVDHSGFVHRLCVDESFTFTLTLVDVRALHPLLLSGFLTRFWPNGLTILVLYGDHELDLFGSSLWQVVLNITSKLFADESIRLSIEDVLHSFSVVFSRSHVNVSSHLALIALNVVGSVSPLAAATLGVNVKIVASFPLEDDVDTICLNRLVQPFEHAKLIIFDILSPDRFFEVLVRQAMIVE